MKGKNKIKPLHIAIFSFILLNIIFLLDMVDTQIKKDEILRLHVVSNSNSIEDQIIKLKIATQVESYINEITKDDENVENAKKDVYSNLDEILEISNKTLKENNLNYGTTIKFGKINYDEKKSITYDMPAGVYDSIQVILGDGNGKNIWSLIGPSKKNIEKVSGISTIIPEISKLYNNDDSDNSQIIKYKSKFLEVLSSIIKGK